MLPAATITVERCSPASVKHETEDGSQSGRFELVGLARWRLPPSRRELPGLPESDGHVHESRRPVRTDRVLIPMQVGELQETITVTSDDGAVTGSRQSGNDVREAGRIAACARRRNQRHRRQHPSSRVKVKDVRRRLSRGVSGNV